MPHCICMRNQFHKLDGVGWRSGWRAGESSYRTKTSLQKWKLRKMFKEPSHRQLLRYRMLSSQNPVRATPLWRITEVSLAEWDTHSPELQKQPQLHSWNPQSGWGRETQRSTLVCMRMSQSASLNQELHQPLSITVITMTQSQRLNLDPSTMPEHRLYL